MFENFTGGDYTSSHFLLRRTSWEDHQTTVASDEDVEQPQLYPPTYPEGQYYEQRFLPPTSSTELVGPSHYPSSHPTSYSPTPHVQAEEVQPTQQPPVHVVAPTPVNLIIQTNFTHVEHNYHYTSQESDSPSCYESTPPPTTASSTRSSFSFSSAGSPTSPFGQLQEHVVDYDSQRHTSAHSVYMPFPFRHQYDAVDDRCYQRSPLPEQAASPCHVYPDGGPDPDGAFYPPAGDYGSTDNNHEYETKPESERGWMTHPAPAYGFYTLQNQVSEAWRHPSWFNPAVTKSHGGGRDGTHDNRVNCYGSVGHPTNYVAHS